MPAPASNNLAPGLLNVQGGQNLAPPAGLLGLLFRMQAMRDQRPAASPHDPEAERAMAGLLGLLPPPVVASNGQPRS